MQGKEKNTFLKTNDTLFHYSSDMLIIGTALLICGIYINGINALWHAVVCMAVSVLSEYVCFHIFLKKQTLGDLSALATGLIISLLLPAAAPLWLSAMAASFSIFAVKLPFGGARYSPFVPAAAGICFVSLSFPKEMFTYAAEQSIGMFSTEEGFVAGTTLLDILSSGKSVSLNTFGRIALFSGTYPGAIGTTSLLMMIAAMLYLFVRRPGRLYSTVGFIGACIAFSVLFPRVNSSLVSSAVLELSAGSLLFTAVLLINDPVTSPRQPDKALIYGAAAGVLCMLLRHFAKIEDTACFAVILINALWPAIVRHDFHTIREKKIPSKNRKAKKEVASDG